MARVDVGLAGLGRIGRMHAVNLATRCGVARLSCVFDADPVVAEKVASELDVPWAASFEELLDACDAVAIATSTGSHAELTVTAAEADKPVFCEKPISLDRATTVSTIEAVERAGVPFAQF